MNNISNKDSPRDTIKKKTRKNRARGVGTKNRTKYQKQGFFENKEHKNLFFENKTIKKGKKDNCTFLKSACPTLDELKIKHRKVKGPK